MTLTEDAGEESDYSNHESLNLENVDMATPTHISPLGTEIV